MTAAAPERTPPAGREGGAVSDEVERFRAAAEAYVAKATASPDAAEAALTALVQQAQEDGFYDPPGAEPLRRHINEQAAEIARLRAALAAREAECGRLRGDNLLMAQALQGISPDTNTMTPAEAADRVAAIEQAIERALTDEAARAALRGEEAINDGR